MARARVYRRSQTSGNVFIRQARPMRAKFVFPDGFRTQDQFGNYVVYQNTEDDTTYAFNFPFGPQNLQYDGFSPKFQELSRPFKKPLLVADTSSLRTVSFNAVIADKESGGKLSISEKLERLEAIADSGAPFQFTYGLSALPFAVVLSKFSYTVSYRNLEGEPIRAEVQIQLTESVFAEQELVVLKAVYRTPEISRTLPSNSTDDNNLPVDETDDPPPTLILVNPATGEGYNPDLLTGTYVLGALT